MHDEPNLDIMESVESTSQSSEGELTVKYVDRVRERNGKKEWHILWIDGTQSWEPRENLVDTDGTENIELIRFDIREDLRSEIEANAKRKAIPSQKKYNL